MVVNIILSSKINEDDFIRHAHLWAENSLVTIDIDIENQCDKKSLFSLALDQIPSSFSEAVIDIFLEDESFPITEEQLIICLSKGSIGLIWSVFYRKNIPNYIRCMCYEIIKWNDKN